MKKALRLILFALAIAAGAALGRYLLPGFELHGMLGFGAACTALGVVFHAIDRKIQALPPKQGDAN